MKRVSSEVAPGDKNGRHKREGKRRASLPPRKKQPASSLNSLVIIHKFAVFERNYQFKLQELTIYSTIVTLYTIRFNIKKFCGFFPLSAFKCFTRVSEGTSNNNLYRN